jgi:hypothetical protein
MNNLPGTITLDKKYYISVDPLNWILKEIKVIPKYDRKGKPNKKAGNHCDAVIGYYSTLESALEAYTSRSIKDAILVTNDSWNIEEVKELLREVKSTVAKLPLTLKVEQEENNNGD